MNMSIHDGWKRGWARERKREANGVECAVKKREVDGFDGAAWLIQGKIKQKYDCGKEFNNNHSNAKCNTAKLKKMHFEWLGFQ